MVGQPEWELWLRVSAMGSNLGIWAREFDRRSWIWVVGLFSYWRFLNRSLELGSQQHVLVYLVYIL
jgi:hypothetical protein